MLLNKRRTPFGRRANIRQKLLNVGRVGGRPTGMPARFVDVDRQTLMFLPYDLREWSGPREMTGIRRFSLRGNAKVSLEWTRVCVSYNLKRPFAQKNSRPRRETADRTFPGLKKRAGGDTRPEI